MKKVIPFIILLIIAVFGYKYYQEKQINTVSSNNSPKQESEANPSTIPKTEQVSSYICFTTDEEGYEPYDKIMLGLDENERAIYAQYDNYGKINTSDLTFISQDFPTPGYPTYTLTYEASSQGLKFGEYTQTHSGIYDYLRFTNDDGEVFNFTNIPEYSYVSEPCL